MSLFNERDHARLATLFDGVHGHDPGPAPTGAFAPRCKCITKPYPGYRPEVREAPNGDTKQCEAGCDAAGRVWTDWGYHDCRICNGTTRVPNVDAGPAGKRYLHVAPKYNPPDWATAYLARAHYEACRVAEALGVPAAYYPRVADGTLRVLEYPSAGHYVERVTGDDYCVHCGNATTKLSGTVCPVLAPGAGTAEHTDFDLFTIVLWRSTPGDLIVDSRVNCARPHKIRGVHTVRGCVACHTSVLDPTFDTLGPCPALSGTAKRYTDAHDISPGLHIGELGELVGLGPATPHRVPARPYVQKSIVYFAMPDHGAVLPGTGAGGFPAQYVGANGPTVGQWLKERIARSRY